MERLSKQWQYYAWLIVIARLLLPFAPQENLAGTVFQRVEALHANMAQAGQGIPGTSGIRDETGQATVTGGNADGTDEGESAPTPQPAQSTFPLSLCIFLIWSVTALVLFVRKITIYQSFARYIKAGQEPIDDIGVLNRFGILLSEAGVRKNIELSVNPLISSPLIMGFFRPCIVLPDAAFAQTDFCYTIRHELAHYKRRDMLYKWLVQLVTCVHWFNPFVYLMGRETGRACELSCDEAVIRHLDAKGKAAYGDTLLNAMGAGGNYKDSLACVTLNEGKALLKERLASIMKYREKSKRMIALTAFLTVLMCIGSAVTGVYATETASVGEGDYNKQNVSEPAAAENKSAYEKKDKGYWRYFNYYYYNGMLFGVGWRERDDIHQHPTRIYVEINKVEYPVAFMDDSEELGKDKGLHAFIQSCIASAIESGWGQERPANGFWAVSHVYTGQTPDGLFEYVIQGEDMLAVGLLMPYVKQETVEKYIRLSFEKGDTNLMMILLSEASGIFKINIDDYAKRAVEDGDMGMYIILEPYISPEESAGLKEKAKGHFFPLPEAARLPDLPPLPPLPPLPADGR